MTTTHRLTICSLLVTLSASMASPLAAGAPATSADLAVIVNPAVSVAQLSADELESIFTTSRRNWPDGSSVSVFSYPPDDAVRRAFDSAVLKMSADEAARFWLDQRVRGASYRPPRQVPDPALAARLVAKLPGSIAYVPETFVNANVKVVARIRAGKVVGP